MNEVNSGGGNVIQGGARAGGDAVLRDQEKAIASSVNNISLDNNALLQSLQSQLNRFETNVTMRIGFNERDITLIEKKIDAHIAIPPLYVANRPSWIRVLEVVVMTALVLTLLYFGQGFRRYADEVSRARQQATPVIQYYRLP